MFVSTLNNNLGIQGLYNVKYAEDYSIMYICCVWKKLYY